MAALPRTAICATVAALAVLAARPFAGEQGSPRALLADQSRGPAADETPDADANQRSVFRAGTNLVYVDTYPRRNGAIVEGLTADDFQVFEDGVPQTIELIDFVRVPSGGPDPFEPEPTSQRESDELAADPSNRVFVVYLDLYHTTRASSYQVHQDLIDFVTRQIGPRDVVAVVTQELPVSRLTFSRRATELIAFMQRTPSWGRQDEGGSIGVVLHGGVEQAIAECAGIGYQTLVRAWREELLFSSLENLTARLGDLRDARKNIIFVTEAWQVPGGGGGGGRERSGTPRTPPPRTPPIGIGRGGPWSGPTDVPVASGLTICDRIRGVLAGADYQQRFRDLLERARAGNVAFYPVDAGGLKVGLSIADASKRRTRNLLFSATATGRAIETFRTLAENTAGRAIVNMNDIGLGLGQIVDSLSSYYVLGYYSANNALDGRFRSIEVTADRPGVSVTARRGYFGAIDGRPSPEAVAAAEARRPVDEALSQLARARTETDLATYGVAMDGRLWLVAELVGLEARDTWRHGGGVEAAVVDDSGHRWRGEGRLDAGTLSTAFPVPVDIARGPWRVSLRLRSEANPDLGSVLTVAAAKNGPLVYRAPASWQAPVRPTAHFTFLRTERIRIEWPTADAEHGLAGRLLDRRGRPLIDALPLRHDASADEAVIDIPLGSFAAGDYVVEVTDTASVDAKPRLFAFRILR